MKTLRILLIAAGAALVMAGITVVGASATTRPQVTNAVVVPDSQKTLIGVMVDSKDGLTESTINCGGDGKHQTVDGDGTLFMPNLDPHKVTCIITIRRVGSSA